MILGDPSSRKESEDWLLAFVCLFVCLFGYSHRRFAFGLLVCLFFLWLGELEAAVGGRKAPEADRAASGGFSRKLASEGERRPVGRTVVGRPNRWVETSVSSFVLLV